MRQFLKNNAMRIVVFLLPIAFGVKIFYPDVLTPWLSPDGKLYLSIAENFLSTGHFIQTARPDQYVVPFAFPLYITVLRFFGMPPVGFILLNYLSLCVSSVFMYDTEKRLFGRGGFSSLIYTFVFFRTRLMPVNLYVEFFYMFMLCWLQWLYFRDDLPAKKRLVLMNIAGFLGVTSRPVLAPVYAAVVLYTVVQWRKKAISFRRMSIVFLSAALIFGANVAVNYRETGEFIPVCNYSNSSLAFSVNPNSVSGTSEVDYTDEDSTPELRAIMEDPELSLSEKNARFEVLAKKYMREDPAHVASIVLRHTQSMFFYLVRGLLAVAIVGILFLLYSKKMKPHWGIFRVQLLLILVLILTTSLGIKEKRYALPIWPMASIHIASLPYLVVDILRRRHPEYSGQSLVSLCWHSVLRRWKEWFLFLAPSMAFLLYRLSIHWWYSTDSEGDLFFNVAYNFINFGHYVHTGPYQTPLVLPFFMPLLMTVLNFIGLSVRMVVFGQYFLVGGTCLLLYKSEQLLFGRGGVAPTVFFLAMVGFHPSLDWVYSVIFCLFGISLLLYLSLRRDIPVPRRLSALVTVSFLCFGITPLMLPALVLVLCEAVVAVVRKELSPARLAVLLVVPTLVLGCHALVNRGETGYPIALDNYVGYEELIHGTETDKPVSPALQEEIRVIWEDDTMDHEEKTETIRAAAADWVRAEPGSYLRGVAKQLWESFVRAPGYVTLLALLCAAYGAFAFPENRKWILLTLAANTVMALMAVCGMLWGGYAVYILPLASLQLAAPCCTLLRALSGRLKAKRLTAD